MGWSRMAHNIKVKLNGRSIGNAIRQLTEYRDKVDTLTNQICKKLAEIGLKEASVRFANAPYDGTNDSSVSIEQTESGYTVVASGNAVCFIEFGSGVHYNSSFTYPIPKPDGVVGIGEMGGGRGKNDAWRYHGDPGTNGQIISSDPLATEPYVLTHGNPASMPMYIALSEMRDEAERVVKEVFKNA